MAYIYDSANYETTTHTTSIPVPWIIVIVVAAILSPALAIWHLKYRNQRDEECYAAAYPEPKLSRQGAQALCKENGWSPWQSSGRSHDRLTSQMEQGDVDRNAGGSNSVGNVTCALGLAHGNKRRELPHPSPYSLGEQFPLPGAPRSSPIQSHRRSASPLLGRETSPVLGRGRGWRGTENVGGSREIWELPDRSSRISTVEDIEAAQGLAIVSPVEHASVSRREDCDLKELPPAYIP